MRLTDVPVEHNVICMIGLLDFQNSMHRAFDVHPTAKYDLVGFFISLDNISSMIGFDHFSNLFDPSSNFDDLAGGVLGKLFGVPVFTDAFDNIPAIGKTRNHFAALFKRKQ